MSIYPRKKLLQVSVRKYTLERLADIYRVYCLKCSDGSFIDYEFEWIPRKIIMCCYDKDFRPQAIEMVFFELLFPSDISVVERVKQRTFQGISSLIAGYSKKCIAICYYGKN